MRLYIFDWNLPPIYTLSRGPACNDNILVFDPGRAISAKGKRVLEKFFVVAIRVIGSLMRAATLSAGKSTMGYRLSNIEHELKLRSSIRILEKPPLSSASLLQVPFRLVSER